jgi:prevent-host-death family protein
MKAVGVRELKQNASTVLDRVKAGESIQVTERGRPVALIVPIPRPESAVERLIAEGRATRAQGNLCDLPPPIRLKAGQRLPSEILAELRAEER